MGPLLAQLTFVSCEDELGRHIYTYCNLLQYQSFNIYCWMMKQWMPITYYLLFCGRWFDSQSQRIRTNHSRLPDEIQHYSRLHSYQYHPPQIDYSLPHSCQCPRHHPHQCPEQSNAYCQYCAAYIK
eukprot:899319_1